MTTTPIDMTGLQPLPSGHWRFQFRYGSQRPSGTAATLEACAALRDETKRLLALGEVIHVEGATIAQLGATFLHSRRANRTQSDDEGRWNAHVVASAIGRMPPRAVTRHDVLDWLEVLKDTGKRPRHNARPKLEDEGRTLSWQTRKHCLNLLRAFFEWAMNRRAGALATSNPCAGLKVAREDGDEDGGYQDGWYLDAKEQTALLACFDALDPKEHPSAVDDKMMVEVAMTTGLRDGELKSLHVADVDVESASPGLVVRFGSWDPVKKRYLSPKGRKGEKRTKRIPLWGPSLAAMRRWLARLPKFAPKNPLGLVFPTRSGARRWQPPKSWRAAVKAFGVVPHVGRTVWWHLLRHTCASSLLAGWWGKRWSIEDVCAMMRHSSVKVTERYAHLIPSVVANAAVEADAAWRLKSLGGGARVAHDRPTPRGSRRQNAKTGGLLSRWSQVRVLPGAPSEIVEERSSPPIGGVGHSWARVIAAIEAIADGHPAALRIALDALSEVDAEFAAAFDADSEVGS